MISVQPVSVESLKRSIVEAEWALPLHLVTCPQIDEACRLLCMAGEAAYVRETRRRLSARYRPITWGPHGLAI